MFDVLEHLYDVEISLLKIYNSLKTNGILIIETGNYSSMPARILGGYWWYFCLLEHFVFWSDKNLIKTLKNIGFKIIRCEKRIHHKKTLLKIVFEYFLTIVYYILNKLKYGDYYFKICKKLGKLGTPPAPYYPDHILLVAKKK